MSQHLDFFFKNMSPSKSLADYIRSKVEARLQWPVNGDLSFKFTAVAEANVFQMRASVTTADGWTGYFKTEGESARAAADLVLDKMALSLKKHFDKIGTKKGSMPMREVSRIGGALTQLDSIDAEEILKYEAARKNFRKKA